MTGLLETFTLPLVMETSLHVIKTQGENGHFFARPFWLIKEI